MSNNILLWTPLVVLVSEIPCWIFTVLDIMQINRLRCYRINQRPYPTREQLVVALGPYMRTLSIIVFVTALAFGLMAYTSIPSPYELGDFNLNAIEIMVQLFIISLTNDLLFYFLHRIAHMPGFYWLHKGHHEYRDDSFALVNHVLHPTEILMFMLPAAFGPIVFHSHIYLVWSYAVLTNLIGTLGHSGYKFPISNMILLNPVDHDLHHRRPYKNFSTGFCYSIVDRIFGTYLTE